jgi:hypothetical protein
VTEKSGQIKVRVQTSSHGWFSAKIYDARGLYGNIPFHPIAVSEVLVGALLEIYGLIIKLLPH